MSKKRGFTLTELLVVVVILGILTAIALPQYRKAIQRAEAADALVNLKTMFDAAKRYYSYHSNWPTTLKGLDVEFLDVNDNGKVGGFQYSLGQYSSDEDGLEGKYASACRIRTNSADNTYCLYAYYSLDDVRDVYTCISNHERYNALCESMGKTTAADGGIQIGK